MTSLPWISHYGCHYVVHGDDITSDSNGEDCYRFVKAAQRFKVVQRTPGISTTDLVGRMLLCTKTHFISSLSDMLMEGGDADPNKVETTGHNDMLQRIHDYATDESGHQPAVEVWTWRGPDEAKLNNNSDGSGQFEQLVRGMGQKHTQRLVYVDGGFDLFSSGHIEFLRRVNELEKGDAYIIAGVQDDISINHQKGFNYPIMNIYERGLCVLQCKYVSAVIFSAPFSPDEAFLTKMPLGRIAAVYHGPTAFTNLTDDPYVDAKKMGVFRETGPHAFKHVNAGEVVQRILRSREAFAERQLRKEAKAIGEYEVWQREEEGAKSEVVNSLA